MMVIIVTSLSSLSFLTSLPPSLFPYPSPLPLLTSEGGVLRVSDVISHIIQVLQYPVLQRLLAAAYTQILLNHIFPYPHFTMELTPSNWTGSLIDSHSSFISLCFFLFIHLLLHLFPQCLLASLSPSLSSIPSVPVPYSISLLIFLFLFSVSFSLSLIDLQKLFFKFYNAPPESMDQSLIARTIQTILLHSSQHYDVLIPDWYQFFTANIKPAM